MDNLFHNITLWIESSKYVLLFLGTLIEGPIVMLTSGFFYGLGQFDFVPMYIALVLGDFTGDVIWYSIGRFGTRNTIFKYGHFLGITPLKLEKIEKLFNKYHQKILIISKLTMGFGFSLVILITAGMFKVPFKKFAFINFIGGFIWTSILLLIGYSLVNIYIRIPNSIKIIFILFMVIVFIFGIKYLNKYLKEKEKEI
jgi:membrane protein DedA with SNARE-associated domain